MWGFSFFKQSLPIFIMQLPALHFPRNTNSRPMCLWVRALQDDRFNPLTYNQWTKTKHGEQWALQYSVLELSSLAQNSVYFFFFFCWFVFRYLHFINFFKSLSSNASNWKALLYAIHHPYSPAQGQASLNRLLLPGFETTDFKRRGSFIIQIHFSGGKVSDPFLWLCTAIYSWAGIPSCRGCKTSTWAVLL